MADSERPEDGPFATAGHVREPFRRANPEPFGRTEGNVDAVRRLAAIEMRVASIKERLREHVERHEKLWVTGEAGRLLERRVAAVQAPTPEHAKRDLREAVTRQAQRNVHARVARRFTALNTTKARLQNTIIRTTPKQNIAPEHNNKPKLVQAFRRAHDPKM